MKGYGRQLIGRRELRIYLIGGAIIVLALLVGYFIVRASPDGIENPAELLSNVSWITFLTVLVIAFGRSAEALLRALANKVDNATEIVLESNKLIVRVAPENVPAPKPGEPIRLENIALLHTSFLRSDKTADYNDGLTYYQIEIVLIAPAPVLDRVESVTYHLDAAYPEPVRVIDDRQTRFKLKELANGTSIVRADIRIAGQRELLHLNRFIDLRPDGPRV